LFCIHIICTKLPNSAFYDGNTAAANAGNFLTQTVIPALRSACGSTKKIMITECVNITQIHFSTPSNFLHNRTGWPSRGGSIGAQAVASLDNERTALAKLNCASASNPAVSFFAFEYDDQSWKSNANEQSFGIFPKFNNGDIFPAC
jgi:exo-beta-1,3-glucanase (GH17 family)